MTDYILLMHDDTTKPVVEAGWSDYLGKLGTAGVLRGGSEIGRGACFRREGPAASISTGITGFVRIEARDLEHARNLLEDNPVFEAGGTIEIRELPRSS